MQNSTTHFATLAHHTQKTGDISIKNVIGCFKQKAGLQFGYTLFWYSHFRRSTNYK